MDYTRQSRYSDPGRYAELFDAVPGTIEAIVPAVQNLIQHYRAPDSDVAPERMDEIDHRWIDRLLETDQRQFGCPITESRPRTQRVAGCCRDFSLLTVSALRHHGIPARTRIGFSDYFGDNWHWDHVIVDYWNGDRWVFVDPQLDPSVDWHFDRLDMPRLAGIEAPFATSAEVWTAHRRGEIDARDYGVDPHLDIRGEWFIRNYVFQELAHRQRDEVLLWDVWGDMTPDASTTMDRALTDEIAGLLLAADRGDEAAEGELADRYAADPRLGPTGTIGSYSPTGTVYTVDLDTRSVQPATRDNVDMMVLTTSSGTLNGGR